MKISKKVLSHSPAYSLPYLSTSIKLYRTSYIRHQRYEPPDLLALLSPNFKSAMPNAPASTTAMHPLPYVDSNVFNQPIPEHPSAQEEHHKQVYAKPERQGGQKNLCQEERPFKCRR